MLRLLGPVHCLFPHSLQRNHRHCGTQGGCHPEQHPTNQPPNEKEHRQKNIIQNGQKHFQVDHVAQEQEERGTVGRPAEEADKGVDQNMTDLVRLQRHPVGNGEHCQGVHPVGRNGRGNGGSVGGTVGGCEAVARVLVEL